MIDREEERSIHHAALVRLLEHEDLTLKELLDYALEVALLLTRSRLGYIYLYDEDTCAFTLYSWSRQVMPLCLVAEQQTSYHLDQTGLWGEAVRQRRPILVNDYEAPNPFKKGYPEGHVHLRNFLTVPVLAGRTLAAVAGVANRDGDYDERDVENLDLFMRGVWVLVARIQAEERLRVVADNVFDWEYWLGPDGEYLWVSPSCEAVCGYPPEAFTETRGLLELQMIHPEDQGRWEAHLRDKETGREGQMEIELRIVKPTGEVVRIAHTCKPIFDAKGRYLGRRARNRKLEPASPA